MAKRAPTNETSYSPLDQALALSVIAGAPAKKEQTAAPTEPAAKGSEKNQKPKSQRVASEKLIDLPTVKHSVSVQAEKVQKRLSRQKRVLLTADEERQIERLVDRIGEGLGTSLKLSHMLRACMTLLCHAEGELHDAASTLGPFVRPANGDPVALAQFELDLARLLSKALRDAPPLR